MKPQQLPAEVASVETTERVRRLWDKRADRYDRRMRLSERFMFGDGRAWVCSQARGEVLEIAIGTGRNLPHYPPDVRLTGVDLSPRMLEVARRQAAALGRAIDLRVGNAQTLEFPDASFDSAVCTLALCSIPNDRQAIAEMYRVLRPGGLLLLLDHIPAEPRAVRALQALLERFKKLLGSEHLLRRPLERVLEQGFEVEQRERSRWGIIERLAARKPA
jgi:ubiquinone/menaquinone biosynthesis C-methylase UbiE